MISQDFYGETMYQTQLENGLTVKLLPKTDFHKTYAMLTADFGAIDKHFVDQEHQAFDLPAGTAHFLEHKMFEKADYDAFEKFGQYGASANAFTSFTKTSYLFSTTDYLIENLNILLDFVQIPYFSKETVIKEQGIIGQEIQMYQDDADWRLFYGMLENLYPKHPLKTDIAGTKASIGQITPEMLYAAHRCFYQPANLTLVVVGKMPAPEVLLAEIQANQATKHFEAQPTVKAVLPPTDSEIIAHSQIEMAVVRPKVMVGLKGMTVIEPSYQGLKTRLQMNLLLELLFGEISETIQNWHDQGLIDQSFGYEYLCQRGFNFAAFGGDSDNPDELVAKIQAILKDFTNSPDFNEPQLKTIKKATLGYQIQTSNALEALANQLSNDFMRNVTSQEVNRIFQETTLADLKKLGNAFFNLENITVFEIKPQTAKNN